MAMTRRGVRKLPSGRFNARIFIDGKSYNIGTFDDATTARQAYVNARKNAPREEREFLAMWRKLDKEQQEAVMLLLKRISDRYEAEVLSSSE